MNHTAPTPLITTIIPTYRRPKLLRRAILSVLNQTYPHLQVCVYDNASGDETAYVVNEFVKLDPRVKYYCHQENIGAIANFNYAMKDVTTPYFSFLSDDDLLLSSFYQLAVDKLSVYADAMFFAGSTIHVNNEGLPLVVSLSGWEEGLYIPPNGLLHMWEKGHPTWTGILFRKEVLAKFDRIDFGVISDLDFELKIARHWPFYVCPVPSAIFSVHDSAKSANRSLNDIWPSMKILGERYFNDLELSSDVRRRIEMVWCKKTQSALLGVATDSLIRKRPLEASESVTLCIKTFGLSLKAIKLLTLAKMARFDETGKIISGILKYRRGMVLKRQSLINNRYMDVVKNALAGIEKHKKFEDTL